LIPVAFASITLAILLDSSTSFIITVMVSVMAGIICKFDVDVILVMLSGGLVGIYGATKVKKRIDLTKVGLYVGGMNLLVITAVGLLDRLPFNRIIIDALWGLGNGLIFSIALVMVTLPYFENLFGITTNFKLMELSDLNLDLLKGLFLKASGTYQHSLLVSELAERAAEEVGANPLLAKVGGYYHDIGKMENSTYFIENQMLGMNTHDGIKPEISNSILNAHMKDGVEIAKRHNLPSEVIDIIQQHHGTSRKMYFVTDENHEEFRYPGPKPQTKEAALVMLADSVEAATRASSSKDFSVIEKKVIMIIGNYLSDFQLEECPLTLRDLTKIGNSFIKVLSGIYHFRIEYPENNNNSHGSTE
ncbi:MAG: phosphohydrolase, partial [Odoribacter sp.]|nr:phosphohydrolase [Odoribacter sp.]